jgi:hypothetical protein
MMTLRRVESSICSRGRWSASIVTSALGVLLASPALFAAGVAGSIPADLPDFHWHLTARPWQPVNMPEKELLDRMEKAIRAMVPMQYWNQADANDKKNGAIIDPIDKKEIQYGTPMFAFNVATLLTKGRAADLVTPGIHALDRATLNISTGKANDSHGEFFCAPMVKAIRLFEALQPTYPQITQEKLKTWKERMKTKRNDFMELRVRQNWRTFAMKGEWLRQHDGYISDGVDWIEADWLNQVEGGQRERFRRDLDQYHLEPHFFFYHDNRPGSGSAYTGADPETFAYNGATIANLLDMLEGGYNGPSAGEMRGIIVRNLRSSLLLLSGAGEAPAGGRTGEHTWNDSIYANAFELAAQAAHRDGDLRLAGQFRHAVELLLRSHGRFQKEGGLFSITKNQFPLSLKNRYASWSGVANYGGFTLAGCSEVLLAHKAEIAEQPAPCEIGGYAMQLDPSFANVFLNAGGMTAQICTRGETDKNGGVQWHVLGITRFSRTGWDGRLGPGAGHVKPDFSDGVSFSPTFLEDGKWKRVCLEPERFQGLFEPEFVHPLLVRGTLAIAPVAGKTGPAFAMHITLTPDGALVNTERVSGTNKFGIVWPLFEFDGRTVMNQKIGRLIASTSYPMAETTPEPDQQNFVALKSTHQLDSSNPAVRGGSGDFRPIRVTDSAGGSVETFVYPRSAGDPSAESVRASFVRNGQDFSSALGRVQGTLYVGRTSAGGEGDGIDLNGDGKPDVAFDKKCNFILQLKSGRAIAVEADRDVTATIGRRKIELAPYTPVNLE